MFRVRNLFIFLYFEGNFNGEDLNVFMIEKVFVVRWVWIQIILVYLNLRFEILLFIIMGKKIIFLKI